MSSSNRFNVSCLGAQACGHWPLKNNVRGAHNTEHVHTQARSSAALPSDYSDCHTNHKEIVYRTKNQKIMIRQKQQNYSITAARVTEQARLSDGRAVNSQFTRKSQGVANRGRSTVPTMKKD